MTETYLDYAATSALRPDAVVAAVAAYLRDVGATPGRGGHARALQAGRVALRCRHLLAGLFGIAGDPGRIAFQPNATYALNVALFGVLQPGDAVVRTRYDHNSVRRPVAALAARGVEARVLEGRADGAVDLDELGELLGQGGRPARMLVLPHVSNVLGSALPVAEMAARAHEVGALVLLDAAQSAGHVPVDVDALGVDLLAFTGHKGLLGPQGIGGLWVRPGVDVAPVFHGGTGSASESDAMPESYPDRLEAGTQNAPGMAGLAAGVEWVLGCGVEEIHRREAALKARLLDRLRAIDGLRVRSPDDPRGVGIVTVTTPARDASTLTRRLETDFGILTRAGLHCAPDVHRLLGTLETGAVRLSIGWATTEDDIDRAADALAALMKDDGEPDDEP